MRVPSREEVLANLIRKARELFPNMIIAPGIPSTDFAITVPLEASYKNYIYALFVLALSSGEAGMKLLADEEFASTVKRELGFTDEQYKQEVFRSIHGTFYPLEPIQRQSMGVVRVWIGTQTNPADNYILLRQSDFFYDRSGRSYRPLVWGKIEATVDEDTGASYVDIPCVSLEYGSDTNIPPHFIVSGNFQEEWTRNIVIRVDNPSAFTGGRDLETLAEFAYRITKWRGIRFGFTYMAFLEQIALQSGAYEVRIVRSGDDDFVRGAGVDVWVRYEQIPLSPILTYGTSTARTRNREPVVWIGGDYAVPVLPSENGYALSIRQKTELNPGVEYRYNPAIPFLQNVIEGTGLWWAGGYLVLVKSAVPLKLQIYVEGRLGDTTQQSVESYLKQKFLDVEMGQKLYVSSIAEWLLEGGMEYIELSSMQITIPLHGQVVTANDLEVPLNFWEYPELDSLTIVEVS